MSLETGIPIGIYLQMVDGTIITTDDLEFDTNLYTFTQVSTGTDETLNVKLTDKRTYWTDFDVTTWNNIYATRYLNIPAASTASTASIFTNLITTNPLQAPIQMAGNLVANTAADVQSGLSGLIGTLFKNPLVLIALAGGMYFYATQKK